MLPVNLKISGTTESSISHKKCLPDSLFKINGVSNSFFSSFSEEVNFASEENSFDVRVRFITDGMEKKRSSIFCIQTYRSE